MTVAEGGGAVIAAVELAGGSRLVLRLMLEDRDGIPPRVPRLELSSFTDAIELNCYEAEALAVELWRWASTVGPARALPEAG